MKYLLFIFPFIFGCSTQVINADGCTEKIESSIGEGKESCDSGTLYCDFIEPGINFALLLGFHTVKNELNDPVEKDSKNYNCGSESWPAEPSAPQSKKSPVDA